ERRDDGAHGQGQVRAGVAIGDGIDVQVVHPLAARLGRGRRRPDQPTGRDEIGGAHAETFTAPMCTSTAAISRPGIRPTSETTRLRAGEATSPRMRPCSTTTWSAIVMLRSVPETSIPRVVRPPIRSRPSLPVRLVPTTP